MQSVTQLCLTRGGVVGRPPPTARGRSVERPTFAAAAAKAPVDEEIESRVEDGEHLIDTDQDVAPGWKFIEADENLHDVRHEARSVANHESHHHHHRGPGVLGVTFFVSGFIEATHSTNDGMVGDVCRCARLSTRHEVNNAARRRLPLR